MFWGGERLRDELPGLVSGFDLTRLDPASYRLSVGPEAYVSPTGEPGDGRNKPKAQLAPGQGFTIPAGQFGFVLTEETVRVPIDALALISIRSTYKFQGLVNVSGFHVDPNYEGRLLFAVFNAGPGPVHLSRGEECFLIWYADLDRPSQVSSRQGYNSIPSRLTGPIANGLQSFAGLEGKISAGDDKLAERVHKLEREQTAIRWAVMLAAVTLLGLLVRSPTQPAAPVPKAPAAAPAAVSRAP